MRKLILLVVLMVFFGCKKEEPTIYKKVVVFYTGQKLFVNGIEQSGLYYMANLTGEHTFTVTTRGIKVDMQIWVNDSTVFLDSGLYTLTTKIKI
jgi:hypothetical protein